MMEQILQRHPPHLARPVTDRPGVVDHPVVRCPGQDHRVIRRILLQLPVEEQVARSRRAYVPGDEERVALP